MSSINLSRYPNIPPGSAQTIEEIADVMERHSLIPNLETKHLMGFALKPFNLIAFTARYGDAFQALFSVANGEQFRSNVTLLKNLFEVAKELHGRGANPVYGSYQIGDPRQGEDVSFDCELDYRNYRLRMTAIPTAITIYAMGEGSDGIITGYERFGDYIQELRETSQTLSFIHRIGN